jgi:hypothetical protein
MDALPRELPFVRCVAAPRGASARLLAGRLFLAVALSSPAPAFAGTGTLTDDAFVLAQPPTVDVRGPALVVSGTPASVAYIRFDPTSALPPGTTADHVSKATLRLYASSVADATLTVSRVTGAWDEASLAPDTPLALTPEVSGVVVTQAEEFVTVDVTQLVKDWLSGSQPNDGLALVAGTEGSEVVFDSKESALTSHAPTLEIALVTGSGTVSSVSGTSPISVSDPTTTPTISLGVVPASHGGTGLDSPGGDGAFLRSAGGVWTSAPLTAPDVPPGSGHYIRNTGSSTPGEFNITGTGRAAAFTAATQYNIGGGRVLANHGTENLFAGVNAGTSVTAGSRNVFVGHNAGAAMVLGNDNTFVGAHAGANSASFGNTFIGSGAGRSAAASANSNTFVGAGAGSGNTTGVSNAFFGSGSGAGNTTGISNSFFGLGAGFGTTTGSGNAFVGAMAGQYNTTGGNNVFIGRNSGSPNTTQVSNSVAIGTNAVVKTSNTIVLGTTGQVTQIPGRLEVDNRAVQSFSNAFKGLLANNVVVRHMGGGPIQPSAAPVCFRVVNITGSDGGYGLTTCTSSSSSIRYKTDLQPFTGGLDLLQRLQPTLFTWKASGERDIGLIAEEVAEVEPLFTYENDQGEVEGVKYPNLGVVFVNAIKEQQAQIQARDEELRDLRARLVRQEEQLAALTDLVAGACRGGAPRP